MNGTVTSRPLDRGAVVLSIDTERIWGYLGCLSEAQFRRRYPESREAHLKLLKLFEETSISATWLVVGGLTLRNHQDLAARTKGLPDLWTARLREEEASATPLWYARPFVILLRNARPSQEIGLHGGLTHLIWTNSTRDAVKCELTEGLRALQELNIAPTSFSFARDQESHHDLLASNGIRLYRGRTPVLAYRLGRTLPGAVLRVWQEMAGTAPPLVWPIETLPGLWNLPSSLFLYPMTPWRTNIVGLRTRIKRFEQGLKAAIRSRGIFHFCLHPENLAESNHGFAVFEEILEILTRARDRGDVEVLTMGDVAALIENGPAGRHEGRSEKVEATVTATAKMRHGGDDEIV